MKSLNKSNYKFGLYHKNEKTLLAVVYLELNINKINKFVKII